MLHTEAIGQYSSSETVILKIEFHGEQRKLWHSKLSCTPEYEVTHISKRLFIISQLCTQITNCSTRFLSFAFDHRSLAALNTDSS